MCNRLTAGSGFVEEEKAIFLGPGGLTYTHIGIYYGLMPRAATTSDAFNAVAEPRRREILNYLALQERPVSDIVASLGLEQPSVSKHLRVLRDVGLVHVRRAGRQMLYRTNAHAIRPMHDWTATFERFWRHQLNRIKQRAEAKMADADIAEAGTNGEKSK
jgi:DNA-binding transcriptional ArsR family regulator